TKVLRAADAVIATSRDLAARVGELGVDSHKVHVIYRGVATEHFYPGSQEEACQRLGISRDCKKLVWVGRMVPVKGLDILLDACKRARDRGVPFQLYLLGDGPLRGSLEDETKRLQLWDSVSFVGRVENERLGDWYRAADVTILPSRSEG